MFSVQVVERDAAAVSSAALGRIMVGDFSETFEMSLDFWSVDEYRRSWRNALDLLVHSDDVTSCLVSSITDPMISNFVFCWPLYRKGNDVFVQNAVIFLESLTASFDAERPWLSIRPREVVDDEGNQISEWSTNVEQVRSFLRLF